MLEQLLQSVFFFFFLQHVSCGDSLSCNNFGPRFDCGFVGITEEGCVQRHCCWALPPDLRVDQPWCFTENNNPSTYKSKPHMYSSNSGKLHLIQGTHPEFGEDISTLSYNITTAAATVHIEVKDANDPNRWTVPLDLFAKSPAVEDTSLSSPSCSVNVTLNPFSVRILRSADNATVFDTSTTSRLIYKKQYIELTTYLDPRLHVYGAGQRASDTLHLVRNGLPRALWNRDLGPSQVEVNSYGSHPFVMTLGTDGTACGYYMRNSNAMDIIVGEDFLSFRLTGGIIDLFVFSGPTPKDVLAQATDVFGRPWLPPMWSFGMHQSKYGYSSVEELRHVVANYSAANIPLDGIWSDIDHMDGAKDFTFNKEKYAVQDMRAFVSQLNENGQHWVPIVDPCIKVDPGYPAYDHGLQADAFIRAPFSSEYYLAQVWPGACHFPDFLHPNGKNFFKHQLSDYYSLVPWSGLWIDMNEVSNFCTGDYCKVASTTTDRGGEGAPVPWECHLECSDASLNRTTQDLANPPYKIAHGLTTKLPLGYKTLPLLAQNIDGTFQYDTHNVYALAEAQTVFHAIEDITKRRPFILSRSSFPGMGAYSGIWTGDNFSTFKDMAWSIPGILNAGLVGIPMVGADICGFSGETTEELCARWMALGSFYPFTRNHGSRQSSYQEPYRWSTVADASRKALSLRYQLLPYIYHCAWWAHRTGVPIARPIWLNYPRVMQSYEIAKQYMLGDSILVSPVLEEGATQVRAFFPPGIWYDISSAGKVAPVHSVHGAWINTESALGHIALHQRGGSIIATQKPGSSVSATSKNPLTMWVALDGEGKAVGSFFVGNEDDIDCLVNMRYSFDSTLGYGDLSCDLVHSAACPQLAAIIVSGRELQGTQLTAKGIRNRVEGRETVVGRMEFLFEMLEDLEGVQIYSSTSSV